MKWISCFITYAIGIAEFTRLFGKKFHDETGVGCHCLDPTEAVARGGDPAIWRPWWPSDGHRRPLCCLHVFSFFSLSPSLYLSFYFCLFKGGWISGGLSHPLRASVVLQQPLLASPPASLSFPPSLSLSGSLSLFLSLSSTFFAMSVQARCNMSVQAWYRGVLNHTAHRLDSISEYVDLALKD